MGRSGCHAPHVPTVDVLAVLHDHDVIVIDVWGQGSGVSPDGIFPGMLPILTSTRREHGRLVVERFEQDKRDDADCRGCDERCTHRPREALVAVVDLIALLSSIGATLATAVVCWCLHAGFVLGRHGDLAFTPQSRGDAALAVLTFASTITAVQRRSVIRR